MGNPARELCHLLPSQLLLLLLIPSSRMGPYHSPPTSLSMISPSRPWALQAPTPPCPGLAPLCPMELESQNPPPSVPSTTTNHKTTTRWSCTRGDIVYVMEKCDDGW